jgi:hypothetical protein
VQTQICSKSHIQNIGNLRAVFATASIPMPILVAKYEKANIDATINSLKQLI